MDVQDLHIVLGSLLPRPGIGTKDDENFKIFDFGLEDLISTFLREKFSFLLQALVLMLTLNYCHALIYSTIPCQAVFLEE